MEIQHQHRALFLHEAGKALTLELRPTPTPGLGSVLLRILAVSIRSNAMKRWQDPTEQLPLPTSFVPGFVSIGRVAEVGPDAVSLQRGQLVFFDPHMIARDDPSAVYLSGFMQGFNDSSHRFARGTFRNSTLAEYAVLPTENCHPLDEQRLMGDPETGGLGYSLDDLTHLFSMLIPFGGLADMDVKAGNTIAIAPATGRYGSAAVHLALAMGARVLAIGRNVKVLNELVKINLQRISAVQVTGNVEAESQAIRIAAGTRGVDGFWDMSPSGAGNSTHFKSVISVLNNGARVSLMGEVYSGVSFDYIDVVARSLVIKGTFMCTREQTKRLISMAETGVLRLGNKAGMESWVVRQFGLEEWKAALETASERIEPGEIVITPCIE